MGRDTIQDRIAVDQSVAYDRACYDVSYLLCDDRADMAERSHVKIAGADYSRNIDDGLIVPVLLPFLFSRRIQIIKAMRYSEMPRD